MSSQTARPQQGQTTATPSVQVRVLSAQAQAPKDSVTPSLLNSGSDILSSLRLPEQQKLLFAAAQNHLAAQLKSSMAQSLPASIVLSASTLQGLTVASASPPTSQTTKLSGQFVTPYQTDSQLLTQPVVTIPTSMMGIPQSQQPYYDGTNPQHLSLGLGMHDPVGISHTSRAHPQTMQWLLDNYETAEGVSLPRSTLYNHYLRHCAANKIDAVNAASFGKLIRSVFIGLKTRRLGTRGNSKYHYYGIRIKPDSPLNTFPIDDSPVEAMRQRTQSTQREYQSGDVSGESGEGLAPGELTPQQQHQQYLGERRPELPTFPEIHWDATPVPASITPDDLSDFTALYREHCEAILDVVQNLQFQMVENLWLHFWGDTARSLDQGVEDETGQNLPKEKLILLTSCQPVLDYLSACDHILYQCIVDFLITDVLRPIPATLTQAIRNFAKNLEGWLTNSIHGYPTEAINSKVSTVVAFSQTLRRYTSLNHLAQAARAVLQNPSQISQMLADLNRVDFANVQEQASWVCECDESLVEKLEHDFKTALQQQKSLEQWAHWLEEVVDTILRPFIGGPDFAKAAKQFLLKWSFYSSMVIRDLTLRSAASFGSFHLIRLLYDEYMFFLIEHKVADAMGKTTIDIMTESMQHSRAIFRADSFDNGQEEEILPTAKRPRLRVGRDSH
eukprot:Em0011g976a